MTDVISNLFVLLNTLQGRFSSPQDFFNDEEGSSESEILLPSISYELNGFIRGAFFGGKVVDNRLVVVIAKPHILKDDMPVDVVGQERILDIGNFLLLVEKLEDALGRGGSLLQDVGDIGDLRERLGERAHVLDKGLDVTNSNRVLGREVPP